MDEPYTRDWWLWQFYRQAAEFVNDPSSVSEARLKALILEYRGFHEEQNVGLRNNGHWAVDC